MLEITRLRKTYSERTVLDIPHLVFEKGAYAIKGSNGSGKTTFFKCICGIAGFEGDCLIEGVSMKKEPVAYRRLISLAEAEPQFPRFLTLNDLLRFVGKARRAGDLQIEELKEAFDLESFMTQPVRTWSSGMLKKAALALAFMGNPKIICLDEPFTTIDRPSLRNFIELAAKYRRQYGTAFLISSHVKDAHTWRDYDAVYEIVNANLVIRSGQDE